MADKVLSQEEVDALLKGMASGEVEVEKKEEEPEGVRTYDLTSQERIIRGRMPTMEVINERFCRIFRTSIFNFLKKVVEVSVEELKIVKYGEFLKNIPLPASFNIFELSSLRGVGLLLFDANLIFLIVDNLFGGSGKFHTRVEGREFTFLEQRIIRRLTEMVLKDMEVSWRPIYPVGFVYKRSEVNPQFVNIVVPTEVVIATTFNLEIGESNPLKMIFCIPYPSVEPIKEILYSRHQTEMMDSDGSWVKRLEEELKRVKVNVSCIIGEATITLGDLLDLNKGDVIQLDRRVSSPVTVSVEGRPKFRAKIGLSQNHYACQVIESIDREVANG